MGKFDNQNYGEIDNDMIESMKKNYTSKPNSSNTGMKYKPRNSVSVSVLKVNDSKSNEFRTEEILSPKSLRSNDYPKNLFFNNKERQISLPSISSGTTSKQNKKGLTPVIIQIAKNQLKFSHRFIILRWNKCIQN